MKYHFNADSIIDFVENQYGIFFGEQKKEEIILPDNHYINEFSRSENSVKMLFDIVNFEILSVSDNAESISGYSVEEIKKGGMYFVLSFLTFEHLLFPYVWLSWIGSIYKKTGNLDDLKLVCCGMKVKHKNGQVFRGLLRYSPVGILNNTNDGVSKTAIMSMDVITHLVKADFYWMRTEFGLTEKYRHHLFSTDKKDHPYDILSDREKDVLRLIAEGFESKEIGEKLFISFNTVDNHRRNMIAKLGMGIRQR